MTLRAQLNGAEFNWPPNNSPNLIIGISCLGSDTRSYFEFPSSEAQEFVN